ncbi:glycosyltransferase, exosortase A system-associated [Sphingomonas histidinilytica]|jgi:PEP-CTERM/exosortase A-associated glycosyltransferase|uniref:PEP-CTERM/exosortase A-associated glycosyltransferase, Daro_2409 family n=1 Tax=Rhizorhabdus histidinilytica TaxID=439228 RepID=A0A1T4ZU94_9SPHN|nr:TIGR04063 family PEP-CTERM/XrtA system glycosyltransferase [Rhizorhabdus histidinilytica]MBO9377570.1 glycosyltransferase, exosortase A system-associated [Rhizorhabdus histidinilytica]QEH78629.1 glycosyltransferase, exosortase A system-associated [Sphingomonas sp. C8-2]SKB26310.1 PEP-CTERM/exosortase A-associated glycosyltransferase, Daro_2409 family [Rhizorhabdus histidinilytica]
MKILHILDHSLPIHSGYTFRTRAILKSQISMGWQVMGVTGPRYNAPQPDPVEEEGLVFRRTPAVRPARTPVGEWREVAALVRRIGEVAAEWKPDILHAHSPALIGLAGLRAARRLRLPFLYEIRAFWEDAAVGNGTGREGSPVYRLIRRLETHIVRRADAVAVICEGLRSDLVARGIAADKVMVSPNGVDLELFGAPPPPDEALAAELGLGGAEVIGFIGSFYDYEGLDDLVAAMPLLLERRPQAALLLVGGGPMEEALRAQAAASPAAARIRFAGRVPHQQVDRYYSLIDILAYPRKSMRLTDLVTPLKPLEAMAQRRLVAASNVGGHRELIEDGVTGTLFAPDDPAALAAALAGLLDDRGGWDERRETARAFVERERNWGVNVARYRPVYEGLIAGSAR